MGGPDGLGVSEVSGIAFAVLMLAVLLTWPVLPGLRRLASFKAFPPFRDWTARPHPDAAVGVEAGRRLAAPRQGTGDQTHAQVVVRTAWGTYPSRQWTPDFRTSRPLIPVVSVDGVPASWGWGTTRLTVPPGRHLIAVTGSHSRCYREVEAKRGERIELDYCSIIGSRAHRHSEAGADVFDGITFGPRRSALGRDGMFVAIVAATIALTAVLSIVLVTASSLDSAAIGTWITYGATGIGGAIAVGVIASSVFKQVRGRRVTVAEAPPYGAEGRTRVLDADAPARMSPAPGWGGLGLHLRFALAEYDQRAQSLLAGSERLSALQRWRMVRIGEPEAPGCRPWVPAPEVFVDGRPVRAGWTRMWLQLAPGEHDIAVRVPAPASQVDAATALDLAGAEWRSRVLVAENETKDLAVTADIAAVPRADGPKLAGFRARLY